MVGSRAIIPRLGETWGAPVIARTQTSMRGEAVWSVFVGGGVVPSSTRSSPGATLLRARRARPGRCSPTDPTPPPSASGTTPADPAPNGVAAPSDPLPTRGRLPGRTGLLQRHRGEGLADEPVQPGHDDLEARDHLGVSVLRPGQHQRGLRAGRERRSHAHPRRHHGAPRSISGVPLTLPIPTVPRAKIYNRPDDRLDTTGSLNVYVGTGDSDNPGQARTVRLLLRTRGTAGPAARRRCSSSGSTRARRCSPSRPSRQHHLRHHLRSGEHPAARLRGRPRVPLRLRRPDRSPGPRALGPVQRQRCRPPSSTWATCATPARPRGIPSTPVVRGNKLYVAIETDPAHPRQIDLVGTPLTIKVKGWQRVK